MPRRGAPSRAREASRPASTWAGEKFAETRRERLALRDSGCRRGFWAREGPRDWRRAPGARRGGRVRSLRDAASPPVSAILPRGARPLSLSRSLSSCAVSPAIATATSQLGFLCFQAAGDGTLPQGRREVASALSDGDAVGLRLGMLL